MISDNQSAVRFLLVIVLVGFASYMISFATYWYMLPKDNTPLPSPTEIVYESTRSVD